METIPNSALYHTPFGPFILEWDNRGLTKFDMLRSGSDINTQFSRESLISGSLPYKAFNQLDAYFQGELRTFTLPLNPSGTPFQLSVWNALLDIPYGQTRSYGQIASAIGNPKASRAVGMANHRNPIAIIIPCHRVIGANGKQVGYGYGLDMQHKLLDLEQAANFATV